MSNPDGWGVAYYEGSDVTILREPQAANESKLVQFIEKNIPPTQLLISHIRKATKGELALKNTHPFSRELGGCMHVFAHNGHSKHIQKNMMLQSEHFLPIGDTDSEYAFCSLLEKLALPWGNKQGEKPSLDERFKIVSKFAEQLIKLGPANFLYSDSDFLFVHADKRLQNDGFIKPPGLYLLTRECNAEIHHGLRKHGLNMTGQDTELKQKITIIASVPLTDEEWHPIPQGEVLVFSKGKRILI